MRLGRLGLADFRCYENVELSPSPGCTVITGANGQGKTSVLEATAWIATGRSFRGVPDAALVRAGSNEAIVRAEVVRDERTTLVEAAIRVTGRNRVIVNKQELGRRRDLLDSLRVTVFSPDDLELVKGGPARRREYLDDLLEAGAPRYAAARADFDRVLKQRNALLRGGVRGADDRSTLDVLDERLVSSAGELVRGRLRLAALLRPKIQAAYRGLAGDAPGFAAHYEAQWCEEKLDVHHVEEVEALLHEALIGLRRREIERGVTLVGPHRDDWHLLLSELDARHHASQGEQRTLALALRMAGHRVIADVVGAEPVLLLDDVFSELDEQRAAALVANLPSSQTLLTTAGAVPPGVHADAWLQVAGGGIMAR